MGYVITIFRSRKEGKQSIGQDEWRQLVSQDSSLEYCTSEETVVRWTAHPKGHEVSFSYDEGEITGTPRDDATTRKMQQMARKLDARMQGEEGELLEDVDLSEQPPLGGLVLLALVCLGLLAAWLVWRYSS